MNNTQNIEEPLVKKDKGSIPALRDSYGRVFVRGTGAPEIPSFTTVRFNFDPESGRYVTDDVKIFREPEVQIIFTKIYEENEHRLKEAGQSMMKNQKRKKKAFYLALVMAIFFVIIELFPTTFGRYYDLLLYTTVGVGVIASIYFLLISAVTKQGISKNLWNELNLKISDQLIHHSRNYIDYEGFYWYKDIDWKTICMDKFPYHKKEHSRVLKVKPDGTVAVGNAQAGNDNVNIELKPVGNGRE